MSDGGIQYHQTVGQWQQFDELNQESAMPKIGEMIESKFLKKEDVDPPVLVTVDRVAQNNVAMQGADPEMKWCLYFGELDKPMVMNSTNIHLAGQACGSDDTDDWLGKKIVLYNDPNVSFGGKLTGGIRIRAQRKVQEPVVPQRKPAPQQAAPAAAAQRAAGHFEGMADDIPF